jgi:ribonuclease D
VTAGVERADAIPLVTTERGLAELVDTLGGQPRFALDTEFHRERTYFPQLALVQVAWEGGLALIDPLEVNVAALGELFGPGHEVVLHAADQDLEVLDLAVGTIPERMFDTQVAAGFMGMSTPSLTSLCERLVGVDLPKGERMTDWLARPLGERQLSYAAGDVAHLLEVQAIEVEDLQRRGRLQWALDEIELRRQRARPDRDPDDAWMRVKDVRKLSGRARLVAMEVAAWRERRAAETDQPLRFVLPDMALITIAQRQPGSRRELEAIRGVDGRHLARGGADGLLDAISRGTQRKAPPPAAAGPELDRNLKPVVGLVTAWVSQLGRDLDIDPGLLATRADIEAFLRGDDDARLASGWRGEILGQPIGDLVGGRSALAFEGDGRLVLEARQG